MSDSAPKPCWRIKIHQWSGIHVTLDDEFHRIEIRHAVENQAPQIISMHVTDAERVADAIYKLRSLSQYTPGPNG